MTFPNKVKVSALETKCPDYVLYKNEWLNLELLNEAGSALRESTQLQGILVRRPKEPQEIYNARVAGFTYQPILPSITGWYTSKLFERNAEITGLSPDEFWVDFKNDCDRNGASLEACSSEVFRNAFLYTTAYTLIDTPGQNPDVNMASYADQKEAGVLDPYLCNFSPSQVTNYTLDRFGALNSIVIRTDSVETPFLKPARMVTEWRYFDQQEFAVYQSIHEGKEGAPPLARWDDGAEAELRITGFHALAAVNRVPVIRSEMPDPLRMARRAYLQLLDHVNQDNAFKFALMNACLAMPIITSNDNIEALNLGETLWLQLPVGSSYGYLEPSGRTFQFAADRLSAIRQELYRDFHLQAQGRDSSASASSNSGYSKELDMAPAKDVLAACADWTQAAMTNILKLVAMARGEDPEQISVRMPQFDQVQTLAEIETGQALDTIDIQSDTLYKIRNRRIALAYMQDEPEDEKQIVLAELESAPGKSQAAEQQRQTQLLQFQTSLAKASMRETAHEELAVQSAATA